VKHFSVNHKLLSQLIFGATYDAIKIEIPAAVIDAGSADST
jgi:hypothetical protein